MTIQSSVPDKDRVISAASTSPCVTGKTGDQRTSSKNCDNKQHFATGHLLANLKGRAISSTFVTASVQGIQFVLMLASTMILARLLSPRDFGIVAMVTTVTGFLRIFNDAGLSTATVQREGITHAQVSNLFWTNVVLGITISLLLAVLSPVVAWFYREPRLAGVTLVLGCTFLFSTSTVQHMALLKRQMRFKTIGLIQVSSAATGVLVGVVMAWMKYGYWSLVGMQLTSPLVTFALTWSFSRWRPQLPKRDSGTRSLLHFGAHLTASSFLFSLARGSDGLLIGRIYGSAPLGLYSRAAMLLMRPLEQFLPPLGAVFVPTLSRLQGQPERYRRVVLRTLEVVAMTSFLFGGVLLPLSYPLTRILLGPKWEQAAPIFASFTVSAIYFPVSNIVTWLLTSQGRGRDFLALSLISSVFTVLSFLAGLPFGPLGVAIAYSTCSFLVLFPILCYIAGRRGPVRTKDLWVGFLTHLPLCILVFLVTWLMRTLFIDALPLAQLAICAPVGIFCGVIFIFGFRPERRVAIHLIDTLREFKRAH